MVVRSIALRLLCPDPAADEYHVGCPGGLGRDVRRLGRRLPWNRVMHGLHGWGQVGFCELQRRANPSTSSAATTPAATTPTSPVHVECQQDRHRVRLAALRSTGKPGHNIRLRYKVRDNSGKSSARLERLRWRLRIGSPSRRAACSKSRECCSEGQRPASTRGVGASVCRPDRRDVTGALVCGPVGAGRHREHAS
jgi:hypothetical protein